MKETTIKTNSLKETLNLAAQIGSKLKGGEVIELVSDIGGGKTTFTKGLVKGAGSQDNARSPSFTIQNEYKAGDLIIYHLDFYRLNDPGIMKDMLKEIIGDPNSVVVIEWADIVSDVLPAEHLSIKLNSTSDTARLIQLKYPASLDYLMGNLTS